MLLGRRSLQQSPDFAVGYTGGIKGRKEERDKGKKRMKKEKRGTG